MFYADLTIPKKLTMQLLSNVADAVLYGKLAL